MTIPVNAVVTILLLIEFASLAIVICTINKVYAIEDKLNFFIKSTEKYIKEFGEPDMIDINTYKERYLTFKDASKILDILKKAYK